MVRKIPGFDLRLHRQLNPISCKSGKHRDRSEHSERSRITHSDLKDVLLTMVGMQLKHRSFVLSSPWPLSLFRRHSTRLQILSAFVPDKNGSQSIKQYTTPFS